MADEIKKVITIDTAESITSLKEYKKHIDDLRGALLALDEDSQEYADIVKEIQDEQNKLNTVMKAGKESTEAADGSYNQLCQTMKELKAQWRATADEAERAELGQQILDINNKLKELDASTGNFQRNVGDYHNAFEQAFNTISQSIGGVGGDLSKVMGTTKQMIPLIKACTKTATAGLSGIKKAIASTGIGLLIVAVGTLIAYWDDLKKLMQDVLGIEDRQKAAEEAHIQRLEDMKEAAKEFNIELSRSVELMAAMGATKMDQLNAQLDAQRQRMQKLQSQWFEYYNNYSLYHDAGAKSMRKFAERQKELADQISEEQKELNKAIDETRHKIEVEQATQETAAKKRIEAIETSLLPAEERLRKQYEADIALAEQYGLETDAITAKYQQDLKALQDAAAKVKNTLTDDQIELNQIKQQVASIVEELRKRNMTELELLEDKYNQQKALFERAGVDTAELTAAYEEQRKEIIEKQEDEITQSLLAAAEADKEAMFSIYEAQADQAEFDSENEVTDEDEVQREQRIAQAKYDIERELLEQKMALQQSFMEESIAAQEAEIQRLAELGVDTTDQQNALFDFQCEQMAELDGMRQQYANLEKARIKEVADFEKEQAEAVKKYKQATYLASLNAAGSMFGSLADMMEEGSEEAKALSIMETTINTISGAIGAFLQASSSYPAPYGQIIGGVTAAAVTAAGIAEIAKIKSTKLGSTTNPTAPDTSTPDVGAIVSPLLDEQQDINGMTTLPETPNSQQGGGDKRVYVVESDIAEAGQKVEVREHEATF
ncbi:MAG: hypothetical protein J6W16_07535 [Methanobrevibacter sp.]|nr:hypothetical protein [Methanobrevibacter sp.]